MERMRGVLVLVAVVGCRYGFDSIGAGEPAGSDSATSDSATPDSYMPPANIAFVQVNSFDSNTSFASVGVTLPQAQQQGDFNVVVVAWGDTTHGVSSITDSAGNAYKLAIGPTINTCDAQSIYYAPNIAGSASNTVTVTFDATITFPTLVVLEYVGPTLLDQVASATGTSNSAASQPVTTTVMPELVFAAGIPDNCSPPDFKNAGTGFTERLLTPVSGMLAEDAIATQLGTFTATGRLTSSAAWVIQTATFE